MMRTDRESPNTVLSLPALHIKYCAQAHQHHHACVEVVSMCRTVNVGLEAAFANLVPLAQQISFEFGSIHGSPRLEPLRRDYAIAARSDRYARMKSTGPRKARRPFNADDSQPVMVSRNDEGLVAMPPERVQRLREHLIKELADLRRAKHLECFASPVRPAPTGFAARVAQTACSLCKGFCCRNGDDDAFLDDLTLAASGSPDPE